MNEPRPFAATVLIATLAFAGCSKDEITAYRIPKEKDPEPQQAAAATPPFAGGAAGGSMAATAVPTASGGELVWTAPANWTAGPANAMRKATLVIPDAAGNGELAITSFPGDVSKGEFGGELSNLNRWRAQAPLNLPPVTAADLEKSVVRETHNGMKFLVVDITGPGATPGRLLGAWVPYAGNTWFFKLTGPAALLEKEKAAFQSFVASVKPAASSSAP